LLDVLIYIWSLDRRTIDLLVGRGIEPMLAINQLLYQVVVIFYIDHLTCIEVWFALLQH
jgi:hypothetical protein